QTFVKRQPKTKKQEPKKSISPPNGNIKPPNHNHEKTKEVLTAVTINTADDTIALNRKDKIPITLQIDGVHNETNSLLSNDYHTKMSIVNKSSKK
ncbi:unnamed protein product, partial [Didymodactylos carnosus]